MIRDAYLRHLFGKSDIIVIIIFPVRMSDNDVLIRVPFPSLKQLQWINVVPRLVQFDKHFHLGFKCKWHVTRPGTMECPHVAGGLRQIVQLEVLLERYFPN